MPLKVSVIIVNYRAHAELFVCLSSLSSASDLEIIVVDNDEVPVISRQLRQRFPKVKYQRSPGNIGFGAGINLGAKQARGEYLFILNPDTRVLPGAISLLVDFLDSHPRVAVVSPLLLDSNSQPYPWVGTAALTPFSGIFALSFLNKLWPSNPVSHRYWIHTAGLDNPAPIAVAPGTAFLIRSSVFHRLGGFDPSFFMYFEESDLCRRVSGLGLSVYLVPASRVIHYWGRSTTPSARTGQIFAASRFYYFRKHFGPPAAWLVEFFAKISPSTAIFLGLIYLGAYLRFFQMQSLMMFIGDQAWFYLSARDALLSGHLPGLGITSSIVWLHQGPLFTLLLIPTLIFGGYNPVWGSYLMAGFGVAALVLFYFLIKKLFSTSTALLTLAIFVVLPPALLQSRMSYHTSPIPLFELIFLLSLLRRKFTLSAMFLGFLYQLHLLTFIFWPLYIIFAKPKLKHFLAFILGILPFVIAGPVQTFGIFVWIAKHLITGFSGSTLASDAYTSVILIPGLVIIAWLIHHLPPKLTIPVCLLWVILNLLHPLYSYSPSFKTSLAVSRHIHALSRTSTPVITVIGPGAQFSSTPDPYIYLVWWLSRFSPPAGVHSVFSVNQRSFIVQVLE